MADKAETAELEGYVESSEIPQYMGCLFLRRCLSLRIPLLL